MFHAQGMISVASVQEIPDYLAILVLPYKILVQNPFLLYGSIRLYKKQKNIHRFLYMSCPNIGISSACVQEIPSWSLFLDH